MAVNPNSSFHSKGASKSTLTRSDQRTSLWHHHKQCVVQSWFRLWKTPGSTVMIGLVLGIALTLPTLLHFAVVNVTQLSKNFQQAAEVSVFFAPWVKEEQAQNLQSKWLSRDEVAGVYYLSPDDGLSQFEQDTGITLGVAEGGNNPLPAVAVVSVHAEFAEQLQLEALVNAISREPEVVKAQLDFEWVTRLLSVLKLLDQAGFGMGLFFSAAVLLIIGNSIRMAIAQRRDEIEIIKLVGGTDAYVRRPFLYTGLLYGLFGGTLAIVLAGSSMLWIGPHIKQVLLNFNSQIELQSLGFFDSLLILVSAGALGLFGAWIAVSRHISAIRPK